ncbi:hypothetical protein EJ08DRAFT_266147 [Tothia fuscella]|uniref:Uncharacterized protein n=1 Tax=Tothia fuscella TaxID=1048955 RepID=A0A9P4TYB5_9PEZI|nr:hypothetical protein EJ08DRAFT_266147 [Tothia fuscella]
MEITHPRRILAVGAPDSGILTLLKDLTGSAPTPIDDTTAGLSHTWNLKTAYYTVELPVWIDEIKEVKAWEVEFSRTEAREVVGALGAWVYCFRKPLTDKDLETIKTTLRSIQSVTKSACGYNWDGTLLAISTPQGTTSTSSAAQLTFDDWDEICREWGFEYIDSSAKGKNDFGEPVGVERIREALEATEWEGGEGELEYDLGLGDEDGEFRDGEGIEEDGEEDWGAFAGVERDMGMDLLGLKAAMRDIGEDGGNGEEDEEAQVEQLERMMVKVMAIKDTSSTLPLEQKKKFAAKAVNDIMKGL